MQSYSISVSVQYLICPAKIRLSCKYEVVCIVAQNIAIRSICFYNAVHTIVQKSVKYHNAIFVRYNLCDFMVRGGTVNIKPERRAGQGGAVLRGHLMNGYSGMLSTGYT